MALRYAIIALIAGILCLCAAVALAQAPATVPHLGDAGQAAYQSYLKAEPNRAFVISAKGGYGTGFKSATPEAAIQNALSPCQRRDPNGQCRVYSINGQVVWGMDTDAAVRHAMAAHAKGAVEASTGQCREPVGRDFAAAAPGDLSLAAKRLVDLNDALDAGKHDLRALVILRHCRLVFERYKDGLTRDHNHAQYSVTKSVTATLVGILLHQGKLKSVDAPVATVMSKPWFLAQADWQKAERITLKNVMQMSSGLTYKHDPSGHPIYALNIDRFALALSPPFAADPGAKFNYSDGDASITGAVAAAAADQNLYRFAQSALFEPLQMANHDWPYADTAGRQPGGWGLRLRPMDMLKLGQLHLQRGEWNGKRHFAADFPELAWASGATSVYALHWWVGVAPEAKGTPYFYANGVKGQRIFVFPTLGVVASVSATLPVAEIRAVDALIVPAIVAAAAADDRATAETVAALKQRQAQSFNGETRSALTEQDRPRR